MKPSIISITALAAAAAAQPHHRHQQQHQHQVKRQDVVVDVFTDIVTATEPAAIVYVDQNGQPISTSVQGQTTTVPTQAVFPTSPPFGAPSGYNPPAPPSESSTNVPPPPPAPTSSSADSSFAPPAPETTQAPGPSSYSSPGYTAPPTPSTTSSSGSGPGTSKFGYGLSYSPYNADNSCKSQDQVNADLAGLTGYGMIRIYGTDCDQVSTVLNAATAKGMKIFAGVYDIGQVTTETQALIDAANGNWTAIDNVAVGNEAVSGASGNAYPVDQVVSAINQARATLRAAGYNGNVVTVDTSATIMQNPELCQASDFAAANCHAFFNAAGTAEEAGGYVLDQAKQVSQACGGKDTVITESGWPSAGETNGLAVPSEENQKIAIDSLRNSFSDNIVLFSAYNDLWKQNNPYTFNAENYWGIYGDAPS